jgi:hypothetical protein
VSIQLSVLALDVVDWLAKEFVFRVSVRASDEKLFCHLRVFCFDRVVQGCQTLVVLNVELGSETEQKVDGASLSVASCQVQRCITILILEVDIDAHFTEEVKDEIEA